jgi:hypothetical protein
MFVQPGEINAGWHERGGSYDVLTFIHDLIWTKSLQGLQLLLETFFDVVSI